MNLRWFPNSVVEEHHGCAYLKARLPCATDSTSHSCLCRLFCVLSRSMSRTPASTLEMPRLSYPRRT